MCSSLTDFIKPAAILFFYISGNCGLSADLPSPTADPHGVMASLFAEELGLVIEVSSSEASSIVDMYVKAGVPAQVIGKVNGVCGYCHTLVMLCGLVAYVHVRDAEDDVLIGCA
jgi:hypothetical protein